MMYDCNFMIFVYSFHLNRHHIIKKAASNTIKTRTPQTQIHLLISELEKKKLQKIKKFSTESKTTESIKDKFQH